ncbi:spermidine synthase [Streptomyces chattanoogensis]
MDRSFYSRSSLIINTIESTISGDRVFTGNQPDDFALAGLLRNTKTACLLGVGYGGAVRAMLAGDPSIELTLVDNDAALIEFTGNLFARSFPGVAFTSETADAGSHLREHPGCYDVICVDLYSAVGYPRMVLDVGFWHDVREALTENGRVVVNAWGLPEQLSPLAPPSPQHAVAQAMLAVWQDLSHLPCRRNTTFVAPALTPADLRPPVDDASTRLSYEDHLTLGLIRLRGASAPVLLRGGIGDAGQPAPTSRRAIDAEMHARWPGLVEAVTGRAEASADFRAALSERKLTDAATERLLLEGSPAASFAPCIASAKAQLGELSMAWYGEWLCDEWFRLKALDPDWFRMSALWQAVCMARTPLGAVWPWEARLYDMLSAELLDAGFADAGV